MKGNKLSTLTRVSIFAVIVFLGMLWVFPMWRIDLRAPQYPGGLAMQIWISKLTGDVDIINGLNHYIGMPSIHEKDFAEFVFLPALMLFFMAFGIIVFLINRKWAFWTWSGMFALIGISSFYDFYKWEYNYGHNLDPAAPIQVPGLNYQPPLWGYKKMLNFEVLSQPDVAGWFYIFAGVLLVTFSIIEIRKSLLK